MKNEIGISLGKWKVGNGLRKESERVRETIKGITEIKKKRDKNGK